ncbi:YceI family protein [Candidatus Methylomirabilis sp.]|uniref:YceI family protein n=1 Tax=Candidatus Methylomirabilis tolerans TaxID=3123416 RepID=A0AAJ1EK52_9BACT|nr:YceI family protein [Candidatus Methylomirabilis sp.]
MQRWTFEPGHTAAEFCVRHMMVTDVRGHFKNVHGTLEFEPEFPALSRVEAVIDARGLWSGERDRDTHLKGSDFLDVERFPEITFRGSQVRLRGATEAVVLGDLTLRGVTRPIELYVRYLGQWQTPWWEDGVDTGPRTRAGFLATTRINRHEFGVSWNGALDRGGVIVGDDVAVTIDAEAILQP